MKTQASDTPADPGSPSAVGESPESVQPHETPPVNQADPVEAPELAGETDEEREAREAPYGRKADGSPRAKPGRKGTNPQEQRERLESVTRAAPRPPAPSPIKAAPVIKRDYDAVAKVATNLWFNIPVMFFGDDWGPSPDAGNVKDPETGGSIPTEVQTVRVAFRDYFSAKDIGHIDPGVQLALVLGGHTLSRITKPTVKSRIIAAWSWTKSKIGR